MLHLYRTGEVTKGNDKNSQLFVGDYINLNGFEGVQARTGEIYFQMLATGNQLCHVGLESREPQNNEEAENITVSANCNKRGE